MSNYPLAITIGHISATELKHFSGVGGSEQCHVELQLGKEKVATGNLKQDGPDEHGHRHWHETFQIPVLNSDAKVLKVKLYSHHTLLPDHVIAEAEEPVETLFEIGKAHSGGTVRLPLMHKGKAAGELLFLVHTIMKDSDDHNVAAVTGFGGGGATVVNEETERKAAEKGFVDPSLPHHLHSAHSHSST